MAEIVNMPRLGLNENTSVISEWLVKEGDSVQPGGGLFTIETDKSTMTVSAESAGVVLKRLYDDYDVVEVLRPVCIIGQAGEDISDLLINSVSAAGPEEPPETVQLQDAAAPADPWAETFPPISAEAVFASPRAKKLASENGTDLAIVQPTGAEGRILEEDVIEKMKSNTLASGKVDGKDVRVVKLSRIRTVIAKNMMNSLQSMAQLTSHMVYNASAILDVRERAKKTGGDMADVTIGDMILFAVSRTLGQFDYMNAHMVSENELHYFDFVHLGCAVDTGRGLMVPTLFHADKMTLPGLSRQIKALAEACRAGNIPQEKLTGATFTVSNLGGFGVREFTPIINPPQVGILGVGTVDYLMKKTSQGMLYYPAGHLSLTYDHRAVDGAPSARFLRAVCENLENFEALMDREEK